MFFLGIIVGFYKGYGDDIDSHALILSFINIIENGEYSPSRYHGYPFAELFYGFFGYYFGFSADIPYYIPISDYQDVTIQPKFSQKKNPALFIEHRKNFLNGEIINEISGTVANNKKSTVINNIKARIP